MPVELASQLQWWATAGDAVGGIATAIGVTFAIWQVAAWRGQRFQERRADVAATLARNVYVMTGLAQSALANPSRYVSDEARHPATPPWNGLREMHDGVVGHLSDLDTGPMDELYKELTIARFYFTDEELEVCATVPLVIDATRDALGAGFKEAEALLPAPEAWKHFEETCRSCSDDLQRLDERTIQSLKAAASYSSR